MRKLLVVVALIVAGPALAKDNIELSPAATQSDFQSISEDLVATIDYKAVVPAEATGIAGFGVGLILNTTSVGDEDAWTNATGENIDRLGLIGIGATKGLPLGFDIGVFYSEIPSSNVSLFGAELRYALLEGGVASPAVALRGSYVKVNGIDSFDLSSKSVDVSVSKGLAFFTPYAGVGYVFGESDPGGSFFLEKEEVNETKFFLGGRFSLGLFEFTPEVGRIGDNTLINLRLGFSFSL